MESSGKEWPPKFSSASQGSLQSDYALTGISRKRTDSFYLTTRKCKSILVVRNFPNRPS